RLPTAPARTHVRGGVPVAEHPSRDPSRVADRRHRRHQALGGADARARRPDVGPAGVAGDIVAGVARVRTRDSPGPWARAPVTGPGPGAAFTTADVPAGAMNPAG